MDYTELKNALSGEFKDDARTLKTYSTDASIFSITPSGVVFPKDNKDLQILITFAQKHTDEVSLTARGAGTGMSGGSLTTSLIVDFTKYFTHIIEIDTEHETARVQSGVFYRNFEKATLKHGLLLPCYTASKDLNTLGGMVGNNSGGEKSLTYGKMEQYIISLKIVLADGNEYTFSKLSREAFEAKKALNTFEGELYRRMGALLETHKVEIAQAKPDVSKNSAGYYLWNIHDTKEDTFDFTRLLVGSQGTLGFVTEMNIRLVKPHKVSRLLVMFLRPRHMKQLGDMVKTVLTYHPESFESYDDHTFLIVLRVLPSLIKRLGGNIFSLAWSFLPELKMTLTGGIPKLVLLAEFTGDSEEAVYKNMQNAHDAICSHFDVTLHKTKSAHENEKYWIIRRESFNLLRKKVGKKHTAPFIDDVAVRPEKLPEFLPRLYAIMNEYGITYTIAGHVGDGNFHIIPLMDYSRPDFAKIIDELSHKVYTLVLEFDGTFTGEHNDGLIRTPFLEQLFGVKMIQVFEQVKDIFDPKRIFNPHKKVDADKTLLFNNIKKI